VTLADEIFPGERQERLVQTEWADGWTYALIGFEEAAQFLTENRRRFGAAIDQVGLVIFFLQRHRVELALKQLIVERGVDLKDVKVPHSLPALWQACSNALGASTNEWQYLDSAGSELIALLHERDPNSHTFRYPVDRDGNDHARPPFIDLEALERHVDDLVWAIHGCIEHLAESERARLEADQESRWAQRDST
jgi:hypothetical protein